MWPFKKKQVRAKRNPHLARNFTAAQSTRLLSGDTQSASVNYWLRTDLQTLRSRSREQVRNNPYAAQFVTIMDSNIVGPSGVQIQAAAKFRMTGDLDQKANDAIELSLKDWSDHHADYNGRLSFCDMQSLAAQTAAVDGEFVFRIHDTGKYRFQLEIIDPELLDWQRNQTERDGSVTTLGVNKTNGRVTGYYFRELDAWGQYSNQKNILVPADQIIHCFRQSWPNQVRGIPWMAASLFSMKMLDGYDEAAITAARAGAAKMGFYIGGSDDYMGDDSEAGTGKPIQDAEPGHFEDLGDRDFKPFDPTYPHEQYPHFVKQCLRRIAAGQNVSYNTLAKDLEGVNYSSIRAGVLEDREHFKKLQNWFIRCFIAPVYRKFIIGAISQGEIIVASQRTVRDYLPAAFQGRRWPWVDPLKDMQANRQAVEMGLKSYSSLIRDQGDDPDTVWREISQDRERMTALGLVPIQTEAMTDAEENNTG